MKNVHNVISTIGLFVIVAVACSKKESVNTQIPISYQAIKTAFGDNINMNNLAEYAGQTKPNYILKDNTGGNTITNSKATIGRVLFYDKSLSVNNSISCASCH